MGEANVTFGKPGVSGPISSAPVGTALPTDAVTELNVAFKKLGYISEDGLVNENSPESEVIKGWGGNVILVAQTGKQDIFRYTMVEVLNIDVMKEVYGSDNVTGAIETGITIKSNNKELAPRSLVVDMLLKGDVAKRIVIPKAYVTEIGEIAYNDSDAVGYEITILAVEDATGQTHYEYIINPNLATELATLTVTAGASASGNVTITLDGVAKTVALLSSDTTVNSVAAKIRGTTFPGWVTGGTDDVVTFTSTTTGVKTDAEFAAAATGVTATMVTSRQGA